MMNNKPMHPSMHASMMDEKKPAAGAKPAAKEQNPLKWLLGFKETPEEKAAREKREASEKASRQAIDNAIRGGQLPKKK